VDPAGLILVRQHPFERRGDREGSLFITGYGRPIALKYRDARILREGGSSRSNHWAALFQGAARYCRELERLASRLIVSSKLMCELCVDHGLFAYRHLVCALWVARKKGQEGPRRALPSVLTRMIAVLNAPDGIAIDEVIE
jgi:hypothetical protein